MTPRRAPYLWFTARIRHQGAQQLDHIDAICLRSPHWAIDLHDRIDDVVAHAGIVGRKRHLNRLVELKSKVMIPTKKHDEIQYLERMFKSYVHNLATGKAQERPTNL